MSPLRVSVLAYPDCFASEVFGVPDILTMAAHVAAAQGAAEPSYTTSVVSPRRRVTASGGARIDVTAVRPTDVLIVPGFELPSALDPGTALAKLMPEIAAIRAQAASGTAVVSICVGAFLLAEAGLLHGRDATTSWMYADRLAHRYPDVRLRREELVVTDRGVTTTAAFSAMYDFALRFVREHDGPRIARSTARLALLDDTRSSQAPYVDTDLLPTAGHGFSAGVMRRLDQNLAARYDLPALAREFGVSARTMLRRFGAETGRTPLAYLHSARVRRAGHLLETTDRTVAAIAADVGYRDPGTFTALFVRHTGRRPSAYRATLKERRDEEDEPPGTP
ncbi:helix-turn-helix domain-containing protein [Streptomyces sp. CC208A]|uniref:GlxA family transcriptional regulator n=1 Tax=Streptomyces sp. CC208A TaxID=3044573 RepID=UPI0024A9AE97|nr:helix-turn-helix domain-containing protein [Streptomyces sp. CC208A]